MARRARLITGGRHLGGLKVNDCQWNPTAGVRTGHYEMDGKRKTKQTCKRKKKRSKKRKWRPAHRSNVQVR